MIHLLFASKRVIDSKLEYLVVPTYRYTYVYTCLVDVKVYTFKICNKSGDPLKSEVEKKMANISSLTKSKL